MTLKCGKRELHPEPECHRHSINIHHWHITQIIGPRGKYFPILLKTKGYWSERHEGGWDVLLLMANAHCSGELGGVK